MFEQNGLMKNTLMSILKKTLQVVMSERIADISDTIVFDVSALMWTIQWPSDTLRTYIEAFKEFVVHALEAGDVVFVLDRYFEGSTKAYLRTLRQMKEATYRVHVFSEDMPVHPKNAMSRFYTSAARQHSFIIAGVEDVSVEINRGITRAKGFVWLGLRDWHIICSHFNTKEAFSQCCFNCGPASYTVDQY